jgi:carboxylesterase type B
MDPDRANKVLASGLYNPNSAEPDAARSQLELLGTDWVWRCANQQAALNMSSHGSTGRVWLAEFDAGIPYPSNQGIGFCQGRICHQGTFSRLSHAFKQVRPVPDGYHADDIEAVFNTGEQLSPAQTGLENEVLARWSAFARSGTPNAAGYTTWSPIQAGSNVNLNMLVFEGSKSTVVQFQRREQCGPDGFWGRTALFDEQLSTPLMG